MNEQPVINYPAKPYRIEVTDRNELAELAFGIGVAFFIVGLVVGLPVFTVLRLMGVW